MQGSKPVTQNRSRLTRERILDGMATLLETRSFNQLTIAELAAAAQVSPASIHQRFANRDALASILLELYMRRVEQWHRDRATRASDRAPASLRDLFELAGRQAWDMAEDIGHIMRPAYLQSRLRPDLLGDEWARLEALAREGFRSALARFPGELRGTDPEPVAEALACFFNMMLVGRLLHWPTGGPSRLPDDREAFGVMLADFACGYLREAAGSEASR